MTTIVNDKPRDGSAPFFYGSSEALMDGNVLTAFRPNRDFNTAEGESTTPEATMLLHGISVLSRFVGNGESTWPVNDPLLSEFVEVCRVSDDPQSAEYMLVWRDVVINYYKHLHRSVAIIRPISFAEVAQALEEIAKAFEEHDRRLKGPQKHFSLVTNANIQKNIREHGELVTKRQNLMAYLEEQHGKPIARSDAPPSEGEQD